MIDVCMLVQLDSEIVVYWPILFEIVEYNHLKKASNLRFSWLGCRQHLSLHIGLAIVLKHFMQT